MNSRKQMNVDKCWETSPWIPLRKFVACVAKKDKHWIRIHAFSNLSLCKALIHFMISFGPSNLAQDWKWALRSNLEHNGVVMNSRKQMNVDECWETSPWIPLSRNKSLTKIVQTLGSMEEAPLRQRDPGTMFAKPVVFGDLGFWVLCF